MSKYGEIVALAETFMKLGADKANAEKKPQRTEKARDKEPDIFEMVAKKRKELAQLEAIASDLGKLYKKDDKKEEKKSVFTTTNIALFLIASSPITGPLYVWWFRSLLGG